jgi:hypothetical protein
MFSEKWRRVPNRVLGGYCRDKWEKFEELEGYYRGVGRGSCIIDLDYGTKKVSPS